MRVDLHVHTCPRSPCSVMEPLEAVRAAARLGLDAVCLTDHHRSWRRDELQRLEDVAGVRVFGGSEITTADGDILVFGLAAVPRSMIAIADLRRLAAAEGGILIAAHPFRGVSLRSRSGAQVMGEHQHLPRVFEYVDAVEVCNGCDSELENEAALRTAERLGLPGVAGSDAHRVEEVGRCVTVVEPAVGDVYELVAALRNGSCSIERLRGFEPEAVPWTPVER